MPAQPNPFESTVSRTVEINNKLYKYYSLPDLNDQRLATLPYCIRVLLENCVRNCDEFAVLKDDIETILNWEQSSKNSIEIPFKPARVLMQDFTGVPAVVDLAAIRDGVKRLGGDPSQVNPLVPVDLVIDHSVQVDDFGSKEALQQNQEKEFNRNYERFRFLKWGSKAFKNLQIVPPGSGIVHQVNLEYLARVVFENNEELSGEDKQKGVQALLYPDSLVGTDSHTTMINGLGVLGWGVGGIEAEAAMLGQPSAMVLPEVVGYKLTGKLVGAATATDLVLTITQNLRKLGVVGKFVEFYGEGVKQLSVADRATISNMAPEYGATMGFFPIDDVTLAFLRQTNRDEEKVKVIAEYLKAQNLFVTYENVEESKVRYSAQLELDLSTVVPSLAGPKRPHDRVSLTDVHKEFKEGLTAKRGFKGFEIPAEEVEKTVEIEYKGQKYNLTHGSVVIAAITSCTNTSNPNVMLASALVAKKAVEQGLTVNPYVKTSLSPGSGVVSEYLAASGLQTYLDQLGFNTVGYGCMTCIGNSGELPEVVHEAIVNSNLVSASVLSGNRNFEARVHPIVQANYLASPPLVVAYAIAGNVKIDFDKDPLGVNPTTKQPVYLKDIWPTQEEIHDCVTKNVLPNMFKSVYEKIALGTDNWNKLDAPETLLYPWDEKSTYIHDPPFFKNVHRELGATKPIQNAYCLLNLGDFTTTDHISPAGSISLKSSAAQYLLERGVERKDFNTYGARRGNDEVMVRGTFANVRLFNKMIGKPGPMSLHVPTNEVVSVFDASVKYRNEGHELIVIGGEQYGSGSSRDWAAKGPYLLGVKAVIATSFERIHRSNLAGMGIIPLQFKEGESADSLGLTGKEQFTIDLSAGMKPFQEVKVKVTGNDKLSEFTTILRFDTEPELEYYKHGGILPYVLRTKLLQ
ncbi:hypothetical protein C9374_014123 [Naegleria lovaniensis]|uniref:Aconitate hydratase n=1 Tax=Naegleria lovaniensis TaxID=51637 RepID=A0AA88H226_NAELO|nr:uncharacterized protein C9374_014123 [Naegleria lovaniensis]KAG2389563.1 hypothetical protein C9374_014123 [Naegleria lovaniensis]